MEEYLRTQWPELALSEIDTQEELEQSILCGSITRANGTVDCRVRIRWKTARKWLNSLGYKWKDVQKRVYFDRYKRENVVEY